MTYEEARQDMELDDRNARICLGCREITDPGKEVMLSFDSGETFVHNRLKCLRQAVEGVSMALYCSVCGQPLHGEDEVRRLPDSDNLIHDTVECLTRYLTGGV